MFLKRSASIVFAEAAFGFVAGLLLVALPVLGAADAATNKKKPQPIGVSVARGFCDQPFSLQLTSPTDEATIRYTVDGTEPTLVNGANYASALRITNTTLLRAAAFKANTRVSAISTHSYIFLDQVLRQSKDPPSFPKVWNGIRAVYQMDPRVVDDPTYRDRMKDAFKSVPIVSIVCPQESMFGPRGLYLNSMERGDEWEKACSAEMILPDGATAFQIDCGIRMQGNSNRMPQKSPKHSFRLLFKEQYGPTKLRYQMFADSPVKKFDTLILRADYNNSWIHWEPDQRQHAQRTRDAWMNDSARAMGLLAGHNRYLHLFLNGLYWGVYDFAERPDADFAAAYLGGNDKDYDVINVFQAKNGTLDAFNSLNSMRGLARPEEYQQLQRALDITNFIDYLLLNYYAGNRDWGEPSNWYAIRRHTPPGPFHYVPWDSEQILHDLRYDCLREPDRPPLHLAEELRSNVEFRRAFAERVQKHFFGDGALTSDACIARWMKRAAEVDHAIIAESARWGYYRSPVPPTRDRDWILEQKRLVRSFFPQRNAIVLEQLRAVGLFPKNSSTQSTPRK
jgi:hypothetical protein